MNHLLTLCMAYAEKINGNARKVNVFIEIQQSHYIIEFKEVFDDRINKYRIFAKIVPELNGNTEKPVEFSDNTRMTKTYKKECQIHDYDQNDVIISLKLDHDYEHHTFVTHAKTLERDNHTATHGILDPRRT